ncbi:MAG: hypothetical protein KAI17_00875 [Thiotrichaceae bacterium]|nr:hypothetical protein [Thiotrichaceae bacterium]
MSKLIIILSLFLTTTIYATCADFSGKYATNRGSTQGSTVISNLVVTQDGCKEITLKFYPPGGHNFAKTYRLDNVERLSFDDGFTIMHEKAFINGKTLIIEGRNERRYDSHSERTITNINLDYDNNLSEYKYIYAIEGEQMGTVITGFFRL